MSRFSHTRQKQNDILGDICGNIDKIIKAHAIKKKRTRTRRRDMLSGKRAIKLLLADGDENLYSMVSEEVPMVNGTRVRTKWAKNPLEALDMLRKEKFDMIVVGCTTCGRWVDVIKAASKVAVIVLGCEDNHYDDKKALNAGADDFIDRKKLCAKSLEKSIRYCLNRR